MRLSLTFAKPFTRPCVAPETPNKENGQPRQGNPRATPFAMAALAKLFTAAVLLAGAALSALAQAPPDESPPRLRTIFPNGAVLLVENMPQAKTLSVQFFAASRRMPDTADNHGYRHLVEHLALKGPHKDLDLQLERQGIFFLGHTLRDAMQIEFQCAPGQVSAVQDAIGQIMQPLSVTAEDIAHEILIMKQEKALESDPNRLSIAAWFEAYGEQGLDPFGDLDVMAKATPDKLRAYQAELFSANNLVMVISGPVDVDAMTKLVSPFLASLQGKCVGAPDPRPKGVPGRVEVPDGYGEARGARVLGIEDARCAFALAAALGLASQIGQAFVTYTPTAQNGLILVGRTDQNSGVGTYIDGLQQGDVAALMPLGKLLAKRWVQRQLESPQASASLRGLLLCEGPSYKPEDLLRSLDTMTWKDFVDAATLFLKENADIAVGLRK